MFVMRSSNCGLNKKKMPRWPGVVSSQLVPVSERLLWEVPSPPRKTPKVGSSIRLPSPLMYFVEHCVKLDDIPTPKQIVKEQW